MRLIADPAASGDLAAGRARATGCGVRARYGLQGRRDAGGGSGQVRRLLEAGGHDGVLARGDVSAGLIADDLVSPIDTDLVTNYVDVFPALKGNGYDTVDGTVFGVPQGRFANLLLALPSVLPTPGEDEGPASTNVIFEPERAAEYDGRITASADPMSIADAAIYLRDHEEELGIESPYELDREQFEAAVELLREQRPYVGLYWSRPAQQVRAFVEDGAAAGISTPAHSGEVLRAAGGSTS